jgi:hypothetical protein
MGATNSRQIIHMKGEEGAGIGHRGQAHHTKFINQNSNTNDTELQRYLKRRFPHIKVEILCFDSIEEVETKILVKAHKVLNDHSGLTAFRQIGQQYIRYCDFFDALNENASSNLELNNTQGIFDIDVYNYVSFDNLTTYDEKTNENHLEEHFRKRNANLPWVLYAEIQREPVTDHVRCEQCNSRLLRNGCKEDEICTHNILKVNYAFTVPIPEHLITPEHKSKPIRLSRSKDHHFCKNCIPSNEQLYSGCEQATQDIIKEQMEKNIEWILKCRIPYDPHKNVFTPTVLKSNMVLTDPLDTILRKRFPHLGHRTLCFKNAQEIETKKLIQADSIVIKCWGRVTINKHPDLDHIRYCDVLDALTLYHKEGLGYFNHIADIHVVKLVDYHETVRGPNREQRVFLQEELTCRPLSSHPEYDYIEYRDCKCDGCGVNKFDNQLELFHGFYEPEPVDVLEFDVPLPELFSHYCGRHNFKYCNACMPSNDKLSDQIVKLKPTTIVKENRDKYAYLIKYLSRRCVCCHDDNNRGTCKYCKCVKHIKRKKL